MTQKSRHCTRKAWRAGERDGTAGGRRRRLSRSLAGKNPRARAAPMARDPEQSRRRARNAWRAGERDRAGLDEAVSAYREALQEWTRGAATQNNLGNALRVLGERDRAAGGGRRRLSRSQEYTRARAARLGQEHRQSRGCPHAARGTARRCGFRCRQPPAPLPKNSPSAEGATRRIDAT
jgi:hypothetical protein